MKKEIPVDYPLYAAVRNLGTTVEVDRRNFSIFPYVVCPADNHSTVELIPLSEMNEEVVRKLFNLPGIDKRIDMIDKNSNQMIVGGRKFSFLPAWIEDLGNDKFELHYLGKLPDVLKKAIMAVRNTPHDPETLQHPTTLNESQTK